MYFINNHENAINTFIENGLHLSGIDYTVNYIMLTCCQMFPLHFWPSREHTVCQKQHCGASVCLNSCQEGLPGHSLMLLSEFVSATTLPHLCIQMVRPHRRANSDRAAFKGHFLPHFSGNALQIERKTENISNKCVRLLKLLWGKSFFFSFVFFRGIIFLFTLVI